MFFIRCNFNKNTNAKHIGALKIGKLIDAPFAIDAKNNLRFEITLKESDVKHLEKLKIFLQSEHNIRYKKEVKAFQFAFIDKTMLEAAIHKIERKLGGEKAKQCLEAIQNEDYSLVADITLDYYDKGYEYGNSKRSKESITELFFEEDKPKKTAAYLLENVSSIISD